MKGFKGKALFIIKMGWSDVRVKLWTLSKVSQKSPFIKNTK